MISAFKEILTSGSSSSNIFFRILSASLAQTVWPDFETISKSEKENWVRFLRARSALDAKKSRLLVWRSLYIWETWMCWGEGRRENSWGLVAVVWWTFSWAISISESVWWIKVNYWMVWGEGYMGKYFL